MAMLRTCWYWSQTQKTLKQLGNSIRRKPMTWTNSTEFAEGAGWMPCTRSWTRLRMIPSVHINSLRNHFTNKKDTYALLVTTTLTCTMTLTEIRSEERRVGKECRRRRWEKQYRE